VNIVYSDMRSIMERGGISAIGIGEDMTLGEVTQAAELMLKIAPNTGRIIWGTKVDEAMAGHVKVTAVLTGVSNPDKLK
jgi:cell division GTPase FtsZ